jgi:ABC-2 type transport system ATP-binding protein
MSTIIKTNSLIKKFGKNIAVNDLNLEIASGEVFGYLGPNGAGKTTTVRLLNGLLAPTSGSVNVLNKDVLADASFIRSKCGVLTDTNLYEALTAEDNLKIWGNLYEMSGDKLTSRVKTLLEMFGLSGRKSSLVGTFSKGMKQKLAIARALIHDPEILFLDEPTAGLDPEASEEVLNYLKNYIHDGKRTVFLCSHRLEEVEQLCKSIAIIYQGEILASGTINGIIKELWPEKVFTIKLISAKETLISALKKEKYVKKVGLSENKIRLTVTEDLDITLAVNTLVRNGGQILEVVPEKHTLKDIYFKIVPKD